MNAEPNKDSRRLIKMGKININPANKGKFTALKKSTGKSTSQLLKSKNPKVAEEANFARMAKRHFKPLKKGGMAFDHYKASGC